MPSTTINSQNVTLTPIEQAANGELSEQIHLQCAFCEKTVGLYPSQRKLCEKLSGGNFYCGFCLRHGYNGKASRNILPLSFRAIAGYYYFEKYLYANHRHLWISEIQDYLYWHQVTGLQNPVFSYDPDSMLWFVDFNRVGRGRKKIRIVDVMKTIVNILVCFNLPEHIPAIKMPKLYQKYSEAIDKFYTQRYRPEDRRLLVPTLAGCGVWETNKKYGLENTRQFSSIKLLVNDHPAV
jgi:hypothetical protein